MIEAESFTRGSGNVFADIGLPNPEEHLLKARIVYGIQKMIEGAGLSQAEAAEKLGLEPASLEEMLLGQYQDIPVERLLRFINALGSDVEIVISDRNGREGEPSLSVVGV